MPSDGLAPEIAAGLGALASGAAAGRRVAARPAAPRRDAPATAPNRTGRPRPTSASGWCALRCSPCSPSGRWRARCSPRRRRPATVRPKRRAAPRRYLSDWTAGAEVAVRLRPTVAELTVSAPIRTTSGMPGPRRRSGRCALGCRSGAEEPAPGDVAPGAVPPRHPRAVRRDGLRASRPVQPS